MISFKCSKCGGEMTISHVGELMCPYCGTKNNFSDKELEGYKVFRHRMLEYLAAVAEDRAKATDYDYLWTNCETATFTTADGTDLSIRYIYTSTYDGVKMYVGKETVVFEYSSLQEELLDKSIENIRKVTFPSADMKDLNRCIPRGKGSYRLKDNRILWAVSKEEGLFPLPLFGNLEWADTAWIVSRLENIACLLEYNEMTHGGIDPETVFINPKTHEAALLGGWHKAGSTGFFDGRKDLKDIRTTARKLLGDGFGGAPEMFKEFLSKSPAADAYEDFKCWDEVIEKGLGGRHFHKFGK